MDAITELEARLERYPPDRYPVQHATARFHLGMAYVDAGRMDDAEEALAEAARMFPADRLPAEHATALNALGAVVRITGRPEVAADAFERAVVVFERAGGAAERGAALFNLGLARRDLGDDAAAAEAFRAAVDLLGARRAAALRELGTTLLSAGELEEAVAALERALDAAADGPERGAAANVLGLALLASDRGADAVEAFRAAAAAHPRSVRPEEYAMAKANLALALERVGDEPRARLAARQALGVPAAPETVAEQAAGVLERVGHDADDFPAIAAGELGERRAGVVREELARWADLSADARRAPAAAWVAAVLAAPERTVELQEALLGGLLELPPEAMDAIVRSVLEALADRPGEERAALAAATRSAAARFHFPQMQRVEAIFGRLAAELGQEDAWT